MNIESADVYISLHNSRIRASIEGMNDEERIEWASGFWSDANWSDNGEGGGIMEIGTTESLCGNTIQFELRENHFKELFNI